MTNNFLLGIFLLVFLTGCGSSDGGGTVMFNTVNATASADSAKNPLMSDLATWSVEANRCGTATSTTTNDLVNFTIVSTKSIATGTASNLVLQKATIVITPGDLKLTPALPDSLVTHYQDLAGQTVSPGSSLVVPIDVVTHNIKSYFDPCAVAPVYTYNVKVYFDAKEEGTGKSGTIQTGMTVRIADFSTAP